MSAQGQAGLAKQVAKAAYFYIDPTRRDNAHLHAYKDKNCHILHGQLGLCRYHLDSALPAEQQALPWQPSQSTMSQAAGASTLTREDFVAAIVTSKHNEHIASTGRLWRQVSMPASCACACSCMKCLPVLSPGVFSHEQGRF